MKLERDKEEDLAHTRAERERERESEVRRDVEMRVLPERQDETRLVVNQSEQIKSTAPERN